MNLSRLTLVALFLFITNIINAQPDFIKTTFPEGTVFHQNISYANDTLKKHLLDIYVPANAKNPAPLVIWVHGGAWMMNDKYADMGYMTKTIRAIVENGYALASIDYRHSTTAIFPAQIQDCNQAVEFLYAHASQYKVDKNNFALMGFSAGGHLASLLGLSGNDNVKEFYPAQKKPSFSIKAVVDFYGPSNFLLFFSNAVPEAVDNPVAKLLGASPLVRPDISDRASPVTYVNKNDPPFFIVHGEKDDQVPTAHSYLLKSYLDIAGVQNEITVVKDAPHYGVMFDNEEIKTKLLAFLEKTMKK
jgi:acetyl esterase/lipase